MLLLIDRGADVDYAGAEDELNQQELSPLARAAMWGSSEMVRVLLQVRLPPAIINASCNIQHRATQTGTVATLSAGGDS